MISAFKIIIKKKNYSFIYTTIYKMDTMKAAISTLGTHLETIFSEVGTNGDICIHITDSLCYTAETNTTL